MNRIIDYINDLSIDDEYEALFGKTIPGGKFSCLFHENHNTPAMKRYGNRLHCFGKCQRTYGVYDLLKKFNPERINEIKQTIELPQVTDSRTQIQIKPINRDLPISTIIRSL